MNVDITSLPAQNGQFGLISFGDQVGVVTPDGTGGFTTTASLGGNLDRIKDPSGTMLFADCGTREEQNLGEPLLNHNNTVYYSSNFATTGSLNDVIGTLAGVAEKDYLNGRIPAVEGWRQFNQADANAIGDHNRHNTAINIAFPDGHAGSESPDGWSRVKISPYIK